MKQSVTSLPYTLIVGFLGLLNLGACQHQELGQKVSLMN